MSKLDTPLGTLPRKRPCAELTLPRKYLVTIPLLLNAATVTGFCLLSAIVGGQTLAALNPEKVSVTVGIVITCLVSFSVSLLGFRAVHTYERWSWIPNLISLVIAVGCGGHHLRNQGT